MKEPRAINANASGRSIYAYADGNPISNIDPSGLATAIAFGGGISTNPFGHVAIATTDRASTVTVHLKRRSDRISLLTFSGNQRTEAQR
jgi:hypothetical protein